MTVSLYRDERFFVPRRLELGINIHPVPEFLVADELDLRSVREQHPGGSSTSEMLRSAALHVSRINHGAM